MAVILGTNSGFLTTAPTADPADFASTTDSLAKSQQDTSPSTAIRITEIGWWCDTATEEANFEVGIYSHNAGPNEPDTLLAVSRTHAKGTTSGWKRVTGLNMEITEETVYWIAVQLDDTATTTKGNVNLSTSARYSWWSGQTTLENTWSGGLSTGQAVAIYAIWSDEEAPVGFTRKIKISGTFVAKPIKTKVAGTFEDKPIKIKVGGTFQDA